MLAGRDRRHASVAGCGWSGPSGHSGQLQPERQVQGAALLAGLPAAVASRQLGDTLRGLGMRELGYFLEHFAPSFEKTLDELTMRPTLVVRVTSIPRIAGLSAGTQSVTRLLRVVVQLRLDSSASGLTASRRAVL